MPGIGKRRESVDCLRKGKRQCAGNGRRGRYRTETGGAVRSRRDLSARYGWHVSPAHGGIAPELPLVSGLRDSGGHDGFRRLTATDRGRMVRFFAEASHGDSLLAGRITQADFVQACKVKIMLQGSPTVVAIDEYAVAERFQRLRQVWQTVQSDPLPPAGDRSSPIVTWPS